MTTWHILAHFWVHHDLLFTKFGTYSGWVRWNEHHFSSIEGIRPWFRAHGHRLWDFCNLYG